MFTRKIDETLSLALLEPGFATEYANIIEEQLEELSRFAPCVALHLNEDFYYLYVKKALHDYADGKAINCAIIVENQVIGSIGLNPIDYGLNKANLGFWISKHYRGKGIVSKCCLEFIKIAFEELGLTKVEIKAQVDNFGSRRIAEKLGFTMEGIITQAEQINNEIYDQAIYGLHRRK